MPDSLWSHRLYSPWNSPDQNTGVGSLSLFQGIFPTQGSNLGLHIAGRFFTNWAMKEGLPRWLSGKKSTCYCRGGKRHGFNPRFERTPWRRKWQPIPEFLPAESPWIEEPGGLQSMGSQRVRHKWVTKHSYSYSIFNPSFTRNRLEYFWTITNERGLLLEILISVVWGEAQTLAFFKSSPGD